MDGAGQKKNADSRDMLIGELKKENLVLKEKLRSKNEEFLEHMVERGRTEAAIKKSRFILARAQEMAHVGNWAWNVQTGEMNGSDEAYRIYGYDPREGRPDESWALSRVHPDDKALLEEFISSVKGEGRRKNADYRILRPDGSVRYVATVADKVVRDRAGNIKWVYGITQDITERKLVEAEASRLASIVTSSDDAIIGKTLDGFITSWNKGSQRLYGYRAAEAIGKPIDIVVPADRRQELRDILGKIKNGERIEHHETVRVTKEGRRVDVSVTISPITDAAGKIIGASTIAREITERKRADKALQEKQEELEVQTEELEAQTEELRVNNEELEKQIVERKRAEAKLRDSERQLAEAQALTQTGSWEMDLTTGEVVFSDEMLRILGLPPGDHTYNEFVSRIRPEDRGSREAAMREAIGSDKPYVNDYRLIMPDGSWRDIHAIGKVKLGPEGIARKFSSTIQDVTERRRAEEALHESEARCKVAEAVEGERKRFLDVLETLPAMVCLLTPDYHVAFANRSFREKFGESSGRHCYAYCFGRTEPCDFCESYNVLKTGRPHHWEINTPDGLVIEAYDYPFTDVDGTPMILEMDLDVTGQKRTEAALKNLNETLELRVAERTVELQNKQEELEAQAEELEAQSEELRANNEELEKQIEERKRAEKALKEAGEKFSALADNIPNLAWMANADGWIFWYNKQWYDYTGTTPEEMRGWGWQKVHHPDYVESVTREWRSRIETGQVYDNIFPLRGKDGKYRWFLTRVTPIRDAEGKVQRWFGTNTDITERMQTEEAARETSSYLESLINYANAPIIVWDTDFKVNRFNHAFERLTGYASGEIVEKELDILFPPESKVDSLAKIQRTLAGEHWESVEVPIRRKDGETRIALWNSANIYGKDGTTLVATIAQGQDITERKRAEEELGEAKNQAELYLDLMGHDISNMHQIALSQLELAQEVMAEDGKLERKDKELIDTSIVTLERSAKLIDNVRKLQKLRAGEYKAEAVDLGELLADVAREHTDVPGSNATINYKSVNGYHVTANPLLKDVFANLVGNAIKHSGGGATINIGVERIDTGVGAYYRVAVEDDGPGIPDEKKEEVFHRFKRGQTKARGTGLGLYIAKTLVEGFNGRVEVEDRVPGDYTKGSRFSVFLPALEDKHGE